MIARYELVAIIAVTVRAVVGAVDASDSETAVRMQLDLEKHLPFLQTAEYRVLEDCVLMGAELARELWSDAERDETLDELFATAEAILTERRHAEAQRREGMKQTKMALTFRKRQV